MNDTNSEAVYNVYNEQITDLDGQLVGLNKKHMTFGMVKLVWIAAALLVVFRVF